MLTTADYWCTGTTGEMNWYGLLEVKGQVLVSPTLVFCLLPLSLSR